jgi:regulator of cell morphogenesis and NO signaling
MEITENTIIGNLVAEDYRTAKVFKKHKIDFCCQGNRTIAQACVQKNIASSSVLDEIIKLNEKSENQEYNLWVLDKLVAHIEDKHHTYVREMIPIITQYLDKVCKVHGTYHPELLQIKQLFSETAEALTHHMMKEELVLFPFINRLAAAEISGDKPDFPSFRTVKAPIAMMMEEHSDEGERLRKIAEITNDYTPPEEACNTYRVVFALLNEFEEDLHQHIHLENNILFPKAIQLEAKYI